MVSYVSLCLTREREGAREKITQLTSSAQVRQGELPGICYRETVFNTVTTTMTPALRWAATRAILTLHSFLGTESQRQCPQNTMFEGTGGEPKMNQTEVPLGAEGRNEALYLALYLVLHLVSCVLLSQSRAVRGKTVLLRWSVRQQKRWHCRL